MLSGTRAIADQITLIQSDMAAFDLLPRKVRQAMRDMPVPPPASNVLASVRQYGVTVTLAVLAELAKEPDAVANAAGQ